MGSVFDGLTKSSVTNKSGTTFHDTKEGAMKDMVTREQKRAPIFAPDISKMTIGKDGSAQGDAPLKNMKDAPDMGPSSIQTKMPFRQALLDRNQDALTTKGKVLGAMLFGGLGAAAGAGARSSADGYARGSQILPNMQRQDMALQQGESQLETADQSRDQSAELQPYRVEQAQTGIAEAQQKMQNAASDQAFEEDTRDQGFDSKMEYQDSQTRMNNAHANYYNNPRMSPAQVFADAMRSGDPDAIDAAAANLETYTGATTRTQPETGNHRRDTSNKARGSNVAQRLMGSFGTDYQKALDALGKLQPADDNERIAIMYAQAEILKRKKAMEAKGGGKADPIGTILQQKYGTQTPPKQ
jgi:hypothetical protein